MAVKAAAAPRFWSRHDAPIRSTNTADSDVRVGQRRSNNSSNRAITAGDEVQPVACSNMLSIMAGGSD
jgi:hypothetical protein